MTTGASGSYGCNGTNFLLEPTSGRWMPRSPVGITGDGHPIYPSVHEFEVKWSLKSQDQVNQILTWFTDNMVTGSAVFDLPQYDGNEYVFKSYSGCSVYEPERGVYFSEYTTEYTLIVSNIRV